MNSFLMLPLKAVSYSLSATSARTYDATSDKKLKGLETVLVDHDVSLAFHVLHFPTFMAPRVMISSTHLPIGLFGWHLSLGRASSKDGIPAHVDGFPPSCMDGHQHFAWKATWPKHHD